MIAAVICFFREHVLVRNKWTRLIALACREDVRQCDRCGNIFR
jgi:hypothetical protein